MSIVEILRFIKYHFENKKILKYDIEKYRKFYSSSRSSRQSGAQAARDILVYCHVVEKGLSHKNLKPLFGYDNVALIVRRLEEYIKIGGKDSYIISTAVSTLKKYNLINENLGVEKIKLFKIPNVTCDEMNVGAALVSKADFFAKSGSCFSELALNRHSVRLYDCVSLPIPINKIIECIKIAQNCPSACNRQACKVKIITDKALIKKVSVVQGGCTGFGEKSGALLILTVDISMYHPNERRIPMLDSGIFLMNLVYACYERNIGTCILNGSFTLEREKEMQKLVPLPANEMYAAVVALANIPDGEMIKVAHSCKRDVNDIVTVL